MCTNDGTIDVYLWLWAYSIGNDLYLGGDSVAHYRLGVGSMPDIVLLDVSIPITAKLVAYRLGSFTVQARDIISFTLQFIRTDGKDTNQYEIYLLGAEGLYV
jgi:hypothetical protein